MFYHPLHNHFSAALFSGQCDLFLCWASFCRRDVQRLAQLPFVAGGGFKDGFRGDAIQDVEQGRAALDLRSVDAAGRGVAVRARGQAAAPCQETPEEHCGA